MNAWSLAESYQACEQIAKNRAANFYPAFLILPKNQRWAMCSLYAFTRIADDIADSSESIESKRTSLAQWRKHFHSALQNQFFHPVFPALKATIDQFGIDPKHLSALLDGVEMDLEPRTFANFDELRNYCYHVASVVGLACIRIWGCTRDEAIPLAESAGIAFQLTNILRDVAEDAASNRVYLPVDILSKHGASIDQILKHEWNDAIRKSMHELSDRARGYYRESQPLMTMLPCTGKAIWSVMQKTYSSLLEVIRSGNFDLSAPKARISRWRKIGFFLQALPVRFGLRNP